MNPQDIRMVVCDLDNTLVAPPDRKLSPFTVQVLRELVTMGLLVTVATGRTWPSFRPFYEQLPINTPPVLLNGACVFDPGTETELFTHAMDPQDAVQVAGRARAAGIHVNAYHEQRLYFAEHGAAAEHTCAKEGISGEALGEGFTDLLRRGPSKMLLVGPHEVLQGFRREYLQASDGEGVRLVFSEPDYLEVLHAQANKFSALEVLCAMLGVDPQNAVAFGDNENDLELVRDAGWGVAVGDAHATVADAAKESCGGPLDDGVAWWLIRAFGLRAPKV